MFNKALQIVVVFLFVSTVFFLGLSAYMNHKNKNLVKHIEKMKVEKISAEAEHKVKMVEKDFKHINELEKGKSYEEINSNNGTHTITIE